MSNRIKLILVGILVMAVMGVSGCAGYYGTDLVKANAVVVENETTYEYRVFTSYVHQYGDELLVKGKVASRHFRLPRGHVDVAVVNSNGEVIAHRSVKISQGYKRKGNRPSHLDFEVKLPVVLDENSTLRVAIHPTEYSKDFGFDCGYNQAI